MGHRLIACSARSVCKLLGFLSPLSAERADSSAQALRISPRSASPTQIQIVVIIKGDKPFPACVWATQIHAFENPWAAHGMLFLPRSSRSCPKQSRQYVFDQKTRAGCGRLI